MPTRPPALVSQPSFRKPSEARLSGIHSPGSGYGFRAPTLRVHPGIANAGFTVRGRR